MGEHSHQCRQHVVDLRRQLRHLLVDVGVRILEVRVAELAKHQVRDHRRPCTAIPADAGRILRLITANDQTQTQAAQRPPTHS
jgi:hypothetical protein